MAVVDVLDTLSRVRRNLQEVNRLIQDESYATALHILKSCKNNLERIATEMTPAKYAVMKAAVESAEQVCLSHHADEPSCTNRNAYVAERKSVGKGRPAVTITRDQLLVLQAKGFTATQMAKHFQCCKSTVYENCYKNGIKLRDKYIIMDNAALTEKIQSLHKKFPNSGSEMMNGYLRAEGITVQRARVRSILSEVDPVGTASRWSRTVKRRTYQVPCPNSLWHMDAHLKLVRWGFVTHGCIDGYSRLITYTECATAITADVVINMFTRAVAEFGVPSRVRSDHGYENMFVAVLINALRGLDRGSHIAGKSVHNQRIERLWRDVFEHVIDIFHKEFYELENEGYLDPENNIHRYSLQKVYLPLINERLAAFREGWNFHRVRTEKNMCPQQIWLDGMLKNSNSDHTSTKEVFSTQADIATRVRESFATLGLNAEVFRNPPNALSSLAANITLSDEQLIELEKILEQDIEPKDKYRSCVALLTQFNFT